MNYNYFEGRGINVKEVIDISETLPFFEDRRLLILEDTGFFKSSQEEMADYVNELPESTIMVFVETEVDKRNKLFKRVKEKGYVCEIKRPSNAELEKWVLGFVGRDKKKITRDTLDLFLDTVGDDMETISCEIEKLLCYSLNKEVITNEDVLAVCTERIEVKIFDLFDAMSTGNKKRTMEIYYDLVADKEPLMRILFMIVRQFNQLLGVKELTNKGYSKKEIANKLSLRSDWVVGQLQRQCAGYSIQKIKKILRMCAENEEAVKTGNLDEKAAVEMILLN